MTIENIISDGVVKAVKELYGADVEPKLVAPSATKKEFEGDLTVEIGRASCRERVYPVV